MYKIVKRYFAESDQFGESYVLESDNSNTDTKLEVGKKAYIISQEDMDELKLSHKG